VQKLFTKTLSAEIILTTLIHHDNHGLKSDREVQRSFGWGEGEIEICHLVVGFDAPPPSPL